MASSIIESIYNGIYPAPTLTASMLIGDLTLSISSTTGFPIPNFRIKIDNEIMLVTLIAGTTFTVTRGVEGTIATAHSSGASVWGVVTAGALESVFAQLHAVETFTRTQSAAITQLLIASNVITVDFSLSNNFSLSLQATTSQILSNPINAIPGTSGQIAVTQNVNPSTLTFDTNWISVLASPAVTTVGGDMSLITYYVADATHIWFGIGIKDGVFTGPTGPTGPTGLEGPTGPVGNIYDIAGGTIGAPTSNAVIFRFTCVRTLSVVTNLLGSRASAGTAATASTTFNIEKNGISFGTMSFASSASVATFTATATSFLAGDILTIVAPASPDSTLADIALTISGTI